MSPELKHKTPKNIVTLEPVIINADFARPEIKVGEKEELAKIFERSPETGKLVLLCV